MISVIEQEILVDDLLEVEKKLFKLSEQFSPDTELDEAWYIVYNRLQKEKIKEAKMKSEN